MNEMNDALQVAFYYYYYHAAILAIIFDFNHLVVNICKP